MDHQLVQVLERSKPHIQLPIHITSGCRCSAYNASIGGARDSQHMLGRAADIQAGISPDIIHTHLTSIYPNQYGIGRCINFTL